MEDLDKLIVAKGFKSCPKSEKSPNLVTLDITNKIKLPKELFYLNCAVSAALHNGINLGCLGTYATKHFHPKPVLSDWVIFIFLSNKLSCQICLRSSFFFGYYKNIRFLCKYSCHHFLATFGKIRTTFCWIFSAISLNLFFKKMEQSRPLFVYFRLLHATHFFDKLMKA